MIRFVVITLVAGLVLVSGCRTFEPVSDPPAIADMPEKFYNVSDRETVDTSPDQATLVPHFDNHELVSLIHFALNHNFDLNSLRSKIDQEEAVFQKKEAGLLPSLDFSLSGKQAGTQTKTSRDEGSSYDGSTTYSASLSGAYDIDIWGALDAEKKSQLLSLEGAKLDLKTSELGVVSQVAQTWIDIIATREKKKVLDQQIEINRTLLDLQKLRFSNGQADALDLSQQREALAEASSQGPLLEKQQQLLLHSLSFLSGKTGVGTMRVETDSLPEPAPFSAVGIPSALLVQRPDIQAALVRLNASKWDIAVARADRLPSFTLTAQALFSSGKLDLLFQNWVASLTAAIAGPIFDAGLRNAEIERVEAVARAQANLYAKAVSTAIREVEDALVSVEQQAAYITLLEEELSLARLTLKDAMLQYRNGKSSYLAYLTAWTAIERLERQLIGEKATLLKDQVELTVVLGGQSQEMIRSMKNE